MNDVDTAMFSSCFPCNPLPFLTGLFERVKKNGTDSIQSDECKRILWVIMGQAYGQMARINLCDEWDRLNKLYKQEHITIGTKVYVGAGKYSGEKGTVTEICDGDKLGSLVVQVEIADVSIVLLANEVEVQ